MGGGPSKDEDTIMRETKVAHAKDMIRAYFEDLDQRKNMRLRHRVKLEQEIAHLPEEEKIVVRQNAMKKIMSFLFISRRRMTVNDFFVVKRIGKGSFGEVFLVEHKATKMYYAMKKLNKGTMIARGQVAHAWVERYALTRAGRHPYVVDLYYCFQDSEFLYLVMEYVPGGDMLTMLARTKTLEESWARFYIAELVVAIDALHLEGIIHRDIKPDNVLFGARGHIRLSDFGLSKALYTKDPQEELQSIQNWNGVYTISEGERRLSTNSRSIDTQERLAMWKKLSRHQAFSAVGTPNYISPEVLLTGRYDETSDWWSLGIILFEMLVGYPPFWSTNAANTCKKILGWKERLKFPSDVEVSPEAEDLIRRLICDPANRIGRQRGREEFEEHPFFKGIDFDNILDTEPPFIPTLKGVEDTRYFEVSSAEPSEDETSSSAQMETAEDCVEKQESWKTANQYNRTFRKRLLESDSSDLNFAGYSYTNLSAFSGISIHLSATTDIEEDELIWKLGESQDGPKKLSKKAEMGRKLLATKQVSAPVDTRAACVDPRAQTQIKGRESERINTSDMDGEECLEDANCSNADQGDGLLAKQNVAIASLTVKA